MKSFYVLAIESYTRQVERGRREDPEGKFEWLWRMVESDWIPYLQSLEERRKRYEQVS